MKYDTTLTKYWLITAALYSHALCRGLNEKVTHELVGWIGARFYLHVCRRFVYFECEAVCARKIVTITYEKRAGRFVFEKCNSFFLCLLNKIN